MGFGISAAQTAPSPASAASSADEIVEMSVFNVTSGRDDGYFTDRALSSGRLATSLGDMAANVDVLTKAQLMDMGAIDLGDLLGFAVSTQLDAADFDGENINTLFGEGTQRANIAGRARGLPLSRLVDYEEVFWEVDTFNVERTDLFLGTDAILFGNGASGGAINYTKDHARLSRNWLRLYYRGGSHDERRAWVDVQEAVIPRRLGVRFEALDHEGGSFRKFFYKKRRVFHGSLVFRPARDTLVRVNYEQGKNQRQQALIGMPDDHVSQWWYIDDPGKYRTTYDTTLGTANFSAGQPLYLGGRNTVPGQYPLGDGMRLQTTGIPDFDGATTGTLPVDIYDYHNYSFAGPDSRYFQKYRDFRITIEQRLAKNLNFRAYYRTANSDQNSRYIRRNGPAPSIYADPLPAGTGAAAGAGEDVFSGRLYTLSNWRYQSVVNKNEAFSATAAFTPDLGEWRGRHSLSLSYDDRLARLSSLHYQERAYMLDAEGNATGQRDFRRVHYLDPADDSTWHLGPWAPVAPFEFNGATWHAGFLPIGDNDYRNSTIERTHRRSFTAHLQSHWLRRRLVTSLGYRRDRTGTLVLEPQYVPPGTPLPDTLGTVSRLDYYDPVQIDPRIDTAQESFSCSAVLHLDKNHNYSLFFGHSGNTGSRIAGRTLPDAEPQERAATAITTDYGIRLNLLGGKLTLRAGAYKTSQRDNYENMNSAWWFWITRQGGRLDANNASRATIAIPAGAIPGGGAAYASETFAAGTHPLDLWT
ncbi:MAG: hypothetical protein LBC18_00120, partial [Opitutaceae bacterium]|nr:hypothetical protein [Opitutaceae bacterium]